MEGMQGMADPVKKPHGQGVLTRQNGKRPVRDPPHQIGPERSVGLEAHAECVAFGRETRGNFFI